MYEKTHILGVVNMTTRLQRERKKRKWTQGYVAKVVGISLRSYQNYEYGKKGIGLNTANRLEDLFGLPARQLLALDESDPSDDTRDGW